MNKRKRTRMYTILLVLLLVEAILAVTLMMKYGNIRPTIVISIVVLIIVSTICIFTEE